MARLRFLLPASVCLVVCACGQASSPTRTPAVAANGAAVFARSCASCHSLIGNESLHRQGGDLLGYRMTRAQLLGFTRVMPTGRLTEAQLDAVVRYILRAQTRAGG